LGVGRKRACVAGGYVLLFVAAMISSAAESLVLAQVPGSARLVLDSIDTGGERPCCVLGPDKARGTEAVHVRAFAKTAVRISDNAFVQAPLGPQ